MFTHLKSAGYRVALQNKQHVGPLTSFPYEHIPGADDFTDTSRFIRLDAAQPWFMVYASNDPHGPWNRGPTYDPAKLTVPPYLHDNSETRGELAKYYGVDIAPTFLAAAGIDPATIDVNCPDANGNKGFDGHLR